MYSYLYDQFLSHEKYFRTRSLIETNLTDLGINGKMFRLNLLNSPQEIIRDEIKRGVKNIVVIGNDRLVCQVIDSLAGFPDVALGIIPMGEPTEIATNFGIPPGVAACPILSTRLIRQVRLAKINNRYFFYQAEIKNPDAMIRCDGIYNIVAGNASIKIFNQPVNEKEVLLATVQPQATGLLRKSVSQSVFSCQRILIEPREKGQTVKILADDQKEIVAPAEIEITGIKLKVIIGKSGI